MVARPSSPYRSANAGEFSADAKGRVDIKQYYSAGLAYKNIEPVPQSGFRQMGGSWRRGYWRKPLAAKSVAAPETFAGPHTGTQTVWSGTVSGPVAAILVAGLEIDAGTATFEVDAEIAGGWSKIAGPFALAAGTAVTRLAAYAPGDQRVASGLRIRATFSISAEVTIGGVTVFEESGTALAPRFCDLTTDAGDALMAVITEDIADFFTETSYVGAAYVGALSAAMLPDLDFYAEASTIGVFHGDLETVRLLLMGQLQDWRADLWPYDPVPLADLGGVYPKTDDVWELFFRWSDDDAQLYLQVTVNSEPTTSLPLKHLGLPDRVADATGPDWTAFALDVQAALVALPGLGSGITVVADGVGGNGAYKMTITFSGETSGEEYQLSAMVVNTAEISVLAYHTQIGETEEEALFSTARGWPGTVGLMQDRLGYARIPAVSGALALSRIGEYFDLDAKGTTDNAARLDRLRSQTTETILAIKESKYLLAFTDKGAYFATNRTIERNSPMNFVLASEIGIQPNCRPFDLEGEVYYVGIGAKGLSEAAAQGGKQLLSIVYDDVSTSYNAAAESLLASHLAERINGTARQKPETDLDASKLWMKRTDGRLVAAQVIKNQDITGFCEWIAAAGGLVREIRVDGRNRLWLAVERGAARTIEIYDMAVFLQDAVSTTTDLAGLVTGLSYADGTEVWAVADGYVLGPKIVAGGAIDLEDPYTTAIVGRWQAPRWESMPQVYVTPGDEVVFRPGRIHTGNINIIDTTSIAVGANGGAAEDVPLLNAADPLGQPMPAKTELLTVTGLTGFQEGTTMVVTQTRPGRLRVRDLSMGAKL